MAHNEYETMDTVTCVEDREAAYIEDAPGKAQVLYCAQCARKQKPVGVVNMRNGILGHCEKCGRLIKTSRIYRYRG